MTEYTWLLWDILAVVVLFYFVYNSAAKGLIRTLVSFAGYAIAAVSARMLSPIAAEKFYDTIVQDAIHHVILSRFEKGIEDGASGLAQLLQALPSGLQRMISGTSLEDTLSLADTDVSALVDNIVNIALKETVLSILQSLLFLLIFTLSLVLVRHIARAFTGVYKIPVIGTVNTVLGGVVGVLEGVLVLLIAAVLIRLLLNFSDGFSLMNESIMDQTYIWRAFYSAIPF